MTMTLSRMSIGTAMALAAGGLASAQTADIERGHAAFLAKGCYECHGLAAKGAKGVAPPISPPPLPLEAFKAYVRKPAGQMPPYSAKLASDEELQGVYAYLKAMPAPPKAADIPLLKPYVAETAAKGAKAK